VISGEIAFIFALTMIELAIGQEGFSTFKYVEMSAILSTLSNMM
jgi:hypothetical protein